MNRPTKPQSDFPVGGSKSSLSLYICGECVNFSRGSRDSEADLAEARFRKIQFFGKEVFRPNHIINTRWQVSLGTVITRSGPKIPATGYLEGEGIFGFKNIDSDFGCCYEQF